MLKAILQECEDVMIPKPFLALISKMYEDQQEFRKCIEEIVRRNNWKERRIEKRLDKLEEKIDPLKVEERKNSPLNEKAESSCGLSTPGVV